MSQPSAIIIGAGYGGMALANLLGKAGYRVDVFEKNSHLGGRIAVVEQDGYTFDLGPSWYLMPEVFEQYYQLFGQSATTRLDLLRLDPGYKVFFEQQDPVVIRGDAAADRDVFEQIEPSAGVALMRYVARSSRVYALSVRHFLYNNFLRIRDVFKWEVITGGFSMISLIMQSLDQYVSRRFHDRRLRQILEYHMVFLGSSPFQAPAIYTLMSHLDFRSGIYYPRRGMMSLPDDMRSLGARYDIAYYTSTPVCSIIIEKGAAIGVKLDNGREVYADVVVSNADLKFTETELVAVHHQSFPERYWHRRQPGPGALLVSVGVRGRLPQLLHHNLYFVDNWRQNFEDIYETKHIPRHASMYICNPTKTDPRLAPKNSENLFILIPIPAGIELDSMQERTIAERALREAGRAIGEPSLASRVTTQHIYGPRDFQRDYHAWDYNAFGGESHLLRQSILFRTPNKSRKVRNLYYVGAGTLPGIGLPMCLIGAQLVYKRIAGIRKSGPLSEEDL